MQPGSAMHPALKCSSRSSCVLLMKPFLTKHMTVTNVALQSHLLLLRLSAPLPAQAPQAVSTMVNAATCCILQIAASYQV